jgi:hypothetical protein
MELIRLRIPYGFIKARTRMNWREILFGLQEELLDPAVPTELAAHLVDSDTSDATLIELAGLSRDSDSREYVTALAAREGPEELSDIRAKWLFIVLSWVFEHRSEYSDPLLTVEEVHADFGYPNENAGFVRYMPSTAPDLGSRELNEARLYDNWVQYLQTCSRRYSPN